MNVELRLKEAIETGELIKVQYHGGSQPGALREIAPISIQDSKVKVRCYSSNATKDFFISKIEIVEFAKSGAEWEKGKVSVATYEDLSQLFADQAEFLNGLGWHIESTLTGDQQKINLHGRFKNGKIKKGDDVGLSYEKYAYESVVDFVSDVEHLEFTRQITGERKRPWSVSAKHQTTKSYGSLDKALLPFLKWAKQYASTGN